MKSVVLATFVLLAVGMVTVDAQSQPTCPTKDFQLSPEECQEYTQQGAIYVVFKGRTEQLTEAEEDQFRVVIANVSNDYMLLTVLPEHVMIVQRGRHSDTNEYALYFFILNPSLSTVMPVALRKQELYLMVKLNNDFINQGMGEGYDVQPVEPPSGYPLAIPVWAIAILGYVGLIVIIYCVMVLTSDWRKRRFAEFEADLEKQYNETNGTNGIALAPVAAATSNQYEEVKVQRKTADAAVQTPRHVAIQVDPADILVAAASTILTTKAVIENGDAPADDKREPPATDEGDPRYAALHASDTAQPDYEPVDTTDVAPLVSSSYDEVDGETKKETDDGDAAKDAEDVAAEIEGALNEGFEADGNDKDRDSDDKDKDSEEDKVQMSTQL